MGPGTEGPVVARKSAAESARWRARIGETRLAPPESYNKYLMAPEVVFSGVYQTLRITRTACTHDSEHGCGSCSRASGAIRSSVFETSMITRPKTRSIRSATDFLAPRTLMVDIIQHDSHTLHSHKNVYRRRKNVRITCDKSSQVMRTHVQ